MNYRATGLTLIGFLISLESVNGLPVGELQIFPPLTGICLLLLPFAAWKVRSTSVSRSVLWFLAYATLLSCVMLIGDVGVNGANDARWVAAIKQWVALVGGVSVFYVLRAFFVTVEDADIVRGLIRGSLPALALGALVIVWWFSGSDALGNAIQYIRTAFVGPNVSQLEISRASGLSNEPAHFGSYLALILFPALWYTILKSSSSAKLHEPSRRTNVVAGLLAITFIWTFSGTSYVIAGAMLLALAVTNPRWRWKVLVGCALGAAALYVVLEMLFPGNYFIHIATALLQGDLSWVTKYGSTLGPIIKMTETGYVWGVGLGGTHLHVYDVLPEYMVDVFKAVSYEDAINVKAVVGRILVELGVVGALLFAGIIASTYREARLCSKTICDVFPWLIGGLIVALIGTIGSFANPDMWFWLAVVDSRYIRLRMRTVVPGGTYEGALGKMVPNQA